MSNFVPLSSITNSLSTLWQPGISMFILYVPEARDIFPGRCISADSIPSPLIFTVLFFFNHSKTLSEALGTKVKTPCSTIILSTSEISGFLISSGVN